MIFNTSYTFLGDAISGIAVHGEISYIDYKLDKRYMIFGVEMIYTGASEGDCIAFQIVDHDNILGYGADLVLNEWVKKWYVPYSDTHWKVTSEMTAEIPAGLYIRLKYTSVGNTDVPIKLNYSMIWP